MAPLVMGFRDFLQRINPFSQKSLTIIQEPDGFIHANRVSQTIGALGQEGLMSNVVMAPVMWIMRTFTEATLVVQSRNAKGVWNNVTDHPIEVLIDRPNQFYDGDALWKATAVSYVLYGNAYWRKVRNAIGEVIELWYVPNWLMTPVPDQSGRNFISHYDYSTGLGPPIPMAPRDVVHLRFGLDPQTPRLGLPPLRSLLRDVCTDDQASAFSETILGNMGVPGLMVSPGPNAKPSKEELEKFRDYLKHAFSGPRRGDPMVTGIETVVTQFGFDPNKLMLGNLRDIAEERVCAVLGIPAAVVGFGSGLQSTKVGATMRELRRLAWVQCLIPMQKSLAKQITTQLLPDFISQTRRFRARFDTSDVSSFPEDDAMRRESIRGLVKDGVITVSYAQELLGLEIDPTRDVYLGPADAGVETPATTPPSALPNGDTDTADDEDDTESADDMKALEAIALRRGFITNGNGTHA